MEYLIDLFGQGKDLTIIQMGIRAISVFIIAYILIRLSGRRSFGLNSPLDNIIVILLGAILSRAVVGASPFIPIIISSIIIVLLHRLLGWLISMSPRFGQWAEGSKTVLYESRHFNKENMKKALVGKEEVLLAVRQQLLTEI